MMERDGKRILIEVKSFSLSAQDVFAIECKYSPVEFDQLVIVAPSFLSGSKSIAKTTLIEFEPDLSGLRKGYSIEDFVLPRPLRNELETGDHHFRFLLATRGKGETSRFRNQVDKRIKTYSELLREIRREDSADMPIRIFWSASRWAYPKELFYSSYFNHLLRRGLVFDIDGKVIHNDTCSCRIEPGKTVCMLCINAAKTQTAALVDLLTSEGISGVEVVFSGRQGFHVYVLDSQISDTEVRRLTALALESGIQVDQNVAVGIKSVVTMPGSIHGLSMLRAIPVLPDQVHRIETLIESNAAVHDRIPGSDQPSHR
jgi:hypothetical protein